MSAPTSPVGNTVLLATRGSKTGTAVFTIRVPKKSPADFLSSGTRSITIALSGHRLLTANLKARTRGCNERAGSLECSFALNVPARRDRFKVTTYEKEGGRGSALSEAVAIAKIAQGKTTTVPLALEGIIASVEVDVDQPSPPTGTSYSTNVAVEAKDAAGEAIVGPTRYNEPIHLSDTDKSGATHLSAITVDSPSTKITLMYDGSTSLVRAVIGARAAHVHADNVIAGALVPIPPGAVESNSEQIDSTLGGDVGLTNGARITIPAGALPSSGVVQISTLPTPAPAASVAQIEPVTMDVRITFGVPQNLPSDAAARRDHAAPPQQLTLQLPSSFASTMRAALKRHHVRRGHDDSVTPFAWNIIQICNVEGCSQVAADSILDGDNITLKLINSFFIGGGNPITSIEAFIGVNAKAYSIISPGLRYWDPSVHQWTSNAPPAATHPILLLHGIFSSVEDSFGPHVVEQLMANGGYDVVLGYDYNWSCQVDDQWPDVAYAVGNLQYEHLDILAHSMGTLMAIRSVPNLGVLDIQNMILVQGPLQGVLTADQTDAFLTSLLYLSDANLNLVVPSCLISNGQLHLASDWTGQFLPGNDWLNGIEATLNSYGPRPDHVIQAAGDTPFPFEQTLWTKLTGQSSLPIDFDGVISTASELAPVVTPNAAPFDAVPPQTKPYAYTFTGANHIQVIPNLYDDGQIESQIEFQINNADPDTGLYDNGTPSVLMKGAQAQTGICQIGDPSNSFQFEPGSINTDVFDASPQNTWLPEVDDGCSESAADIFTLATSPGYAISSTPTQATVFDTMDSNQTVTTNAFDLDIWALPNCSLGQTPPPFGWSQCVGNSGPDLERRGEPESLQMLDAFKKSSVRGGFHKPVARAFMPQGRRHRKPF
jgi:pimeloyl-ACP methyl ester carboxylesterase